METQWMSRTLLAKEMNKISEGFVWKLTLWMPWIAKRITSLATFQLTTGHRFLEFNWRFRKSILSRLAAVYWPPSTLINIVDVISPDTFDGYLRRITVRWASSGQNLKINRLRVNEQRRRIEYDPMDMIQWILCIIEYHSPNMIQWISLKIT